MGTTVCPSAAPDLSGGVASTGGLTTSRSDPGASGRSTRGARQIYRIVAKIGGVSRLTRKPICANLIEGMTSCDIMHVITHHKSMTFPVNKAERVLGLAAWVKHGWYAREQLRSCISLFSLYRIQETKSIAEVFQKSFNFYSFFTPTGGLISRESTTIMLSTPTAFGTRSVGQLSQFSKSIRNRCTGKHTAFTLSPYDTVGLPYAMGLKPLADTEKPPQRLAYLHAAAAAASRW